MKCLEHKEVYEAIDGEIDYAEWCVVPERRYSRNHSLGEFILMLNEYAAQAQKKWTKEPDYTESEDYSSLHEVRKIAATAVRCMIQHGAPKRVRQPIEQVMDQL